MRLQCWPSWCRWDPHSPQVPGNQGLRGCFLASRDQQGRRELGRPRFLLFLNHLFLPRVGSLEPLGPKSRKLPALPHPRPGE